MNRRNASTNSLQMAQVWSRTHLAEAIPLEEAAQASLGDFLEARGWKLVLMIRSSL